MAFFQGLCNWVCQPPLGQPAVASERAAVSDWPQDFVVNVELLLALTALPAVTISAPPRRDLALGCSGGLAGQRLAGGAEPPGLGGTGCSPPLSSASTPVSGSLSPLWGVLVFGRGGCR